MVAVVLAEPVKKRLKTLFFITMTSEHEGERQNAHALFTRTLKENGLTVHDVANGVLDNPAPPSPPPEQGPPKPPAPKSSLRNTDRGYEIDSDEMSELAEKIRANVRIDQFQSSVLTTLEDRSFKYPTVFISFAQMNVLQPMVRAMKARTR